MDVRQTQSQNGIELRSPDKIMRLARMGSFHQSRLSFMRVLLRRLRNEKWRFDRPMFSMNERGVGRATYRAIGPKRTYTLIVFAHDLPDEKRSDRVIADAWDATFTLFDGEPSENDIERLSLQVPLQEAGRVDQSELVLSRANKSVRLFDHVVDRLAEGAQPETNKLLETGYLMRTTAVYGSGKFGACDRDQWKDRSEFSGSFQPEMLAVWLFRQFVVDWVEHLAKAKGGDTAVPLDSAAKLMLGIGNSTGLGMAPFLINHPSLIHSWINAREIAIARCRNIETPSSEEIEKFMTCLKSLSTLVDGWNSAHPIQIKKVADLQSDLRKLDEKIAQDVFETSYPFDALLNWAENELSLEGQELLASSILEPFGSLVDELSDTMQANEELHFKIDGKRPVKEVLQLAERFFGWTRDHDFSASSAIARVWYTSAEKLEPRLGERFEEDVEPYEQPLSPGRHAVAMMKTLQRFEPSAPVAKFLLQHPEHRQIVRRLFILENAPYGEIRDNTIDAEMLPIDLLRCKLSFFGATKFDPRSDRWVRITMYQNAPYPDQLSELDPDLSIYGLA